MSDTPFMPGWAWGVTAALVVVGAGLMALPSGKSRPRFKSLRGLPRPVLRSDDPRQIRRMFWPNVDKARMLAEEARSALDRGDELTARKALHEARTALKVAAYYSQGPHTESILWSRHNLVNNLEIEAGVW